MHYVVKCSIKTDAFGNFSKESIVKASEYGVGKLQELELEARHEFYEMHGFKPIPGAGGVRVDIAIREVR